jgi:hypothetical protein
VKNSRIISLCVRACPGGGAQGSLSAHHPPPSHQTSRHVVKRARSSHFVYAQAQGGRSGGAVRPPSTTSKPISQTCCERAGSSHWVYAHAQGGAQGVLCAHLPPPAHQTRRHVVKEPDPLTLCTRTPRGGGAPRSMCICRLPPPHQTCIHVVKEQDHLRLCTRMPRGALWGCCATAIHLLQTKLADMCERRVSSHVVYAHA